MRILMIAPEPFFQPRGTPFSILFRCRALSRLGHEIDLFTYPIGEDVAIPNVRIRRSFRPPWIRNVKIGPSIAKIFLDFFLFLKVFGVLIFNRRRYDLIHTHEEACFPGTAFKKIFRIPHLYDMHSSLPQQLRNYNFARGGLFPAVFGVLENWTIRNADSVIAICPDLKETADLQARDARVFCIENALTEEVPEAQAQAGARRLASSYGLEGKRVVVYTGTFEVNQGLDLLVRAMAMLDERFPDAVCLLAGGEERQVEAVGGLARSLGVGQSVILAGKVPATEVPAFLEAATVLVSPRSQGTNTPLKIYQYLKSGRPIVATRLHTHTQALSDRDSVLVEPTAEGLAEGLAWVFDHPDEAGELAGRALELAAAEYSDSAYMDKLARALGRIGPAGACHA